MSVHYEKNYELYKQLGLQERSLILRQLAVQIW